MNDKYDRRAEMDADLEAELAAAMGDSSLEDLIDAEEEAEAGDDPVAKEAAGYKNGKVGTIVSIHNDDIIVEFNARSQGVCPADQFKELPAVGDRVAFLVISKLKGEGLLQLSRPGGLAKAGWESLEEGMTVEGIVEAKNSGGLELKISNHDAFMPISQIDLARVEDLEPYIGQKLRCKITELNKEKRKFVVSRREVLEEERAATIEQVYATLRVGDVITGRVTRLERYGAFIELGTGVEGLAHISDLSWSRVKDPKEVVQVDQVVQAQVLSIDVDEKRVSLGVKHVDGDPWDGVEYRFAVGSDVTGKVTRTESFGAFVEIGKGVEGLIHISQLSSKRVRRADDVVKPGEDVTARVTEIDVERRRIGLSLKALTEDIEIEEGPSASDVKRYVQPDKKKGQASAFESLMGKYDGSEKGGLG